MVEVFKTNVRNKKHAKRLIQQLHKTFTDAQANFDLHDCDNILRVKYNKEILTPIVVINFLKEFGFNAEVLADEN